MRSRSSVVSRPRTRSGSWRDGSVPSLKYSLTIVGRHTFGKLSASSRSSLHSSNIINLHQPDAGRVILTSHDGCVVVRRHSPDKGGFEIVRRRNAGLLNLGLLIVLPVIVGRYRGAVTIVQLQE